MAYTRTFESLLPFVEATLVDLSTTDADYSSNPIKGISFATAGALKIDTPSSTGIVIPNGALAVGHIHKIVITKIYRTGTAAASIVGYR